MMNNLSSFEHGGNIYKAIRQSGSPNKQFLDYSANINPLGLAASVRKSIAESLDDIVHYPDVEAHDLKTAIAEYYQVNYPTITVGNGAVELLYILCHIRKPRRVLVLAPSFSEYERAARASDAIVEYYYLDEEKNFSLNITEVISRLSTVDIIFIGNPNNPTGNLVTNTELEVLIQAAENYNCMVVLDESFIDFLPNDSHYTCRNLLAKYQNLVILHSLTKFYAIPGLRLGFALTTPGLTQLLHLAKDPWNVNTLAQLAGIAALKSSDYQANTKEIIQTAKSEFFNQLREVHNIKCYQPAVNFILLNLSQTGLTANELKLRLFEKNILVRDCSNYPGLSPFFIRLAIKLPEQNSILLQTLKQSIKR